MKEILKLGALVSSGKDSLFAAYLMKKKGYPISCFITIKSKNPDSYMFHTPNVELVKLQAEASDITLFSYSSEGEKELELKDLKSAIKKAMEKFKFQGIVTGAICSNYQKERIDRICEELRLKAFSPIWQMDQEILMRELLKNNFEIYFSSVASYGLDKSWLGRTITMNDVNRLVELRKKYGINVAGEGGEFESLVLGCPLFKKRINIIDSEIYEEDENTARLIVKKSELVNKKFNPLKE